MPKIQKNCYLRTVLLLATPQATDNLIITHNQQIDLNKKLEKK
jgi:hypothetical protein